MDFKKVLSIIDKMEQGLDSWENYSDEDIREAYIAAWEKEIPLLRQKLDERYFDELTDRLIQTQVLPAHILTMEQEAAIIEKDLRSSEDEDLLAHSYLPMVFLIIKQYEDKKGFWRDMLQKGINGLSKALSEINSNPDILSILRIAKSIYHETWEFYRDSEYYKVFERGQEMAVKLKGNTEIPIGITADHELITIPIIAPYMKHCFISGCIGSGKSTLIKKIIESLVKTYDKSQVEVWTCFPQGVEGSFEHDSVRDFSKPGRNTEEQIAYIVDQLYKETENRIRTMTHERVLSYTEVSSLPLLIVIVDDWCRLYHMDDDLYIEGQLRRILPMSHTLGIVMICASELPICRLSGIPYEFERTFNIRIAMRHHRDLILETLYDYPGNIPSEVSEAVDKLLSGTKGDFILFNRYSDSFVSGQVTDISLD